MLKNSGGPGLGDRMATKETEGIGGLVAKTQKSPSKVLVCVYSKQNKNELFSGVFFTSMTI